MELRDMQPGWLIEYMGVKGEEGMRRAWIGTMGWEILDAHDAFGETEASGRGWAVGGGGVGASEGGLRGIAGMTLCYLLICRVY